MSLVLCLGLAAFLLFVLPRRSPQNRAAMIQLRWPRTDADNRDRTFDLCAYDGAVYVGTKVERLEIWDPFSISPGPRPPRRPEFAVGCSDPYWFAGGEYEWMMQNAGRRWRGSGFAYIPHDPAGRRSSGAFVALATSHTVLLLIVGAAAPIALHVRRRRRAKQPHRCPTCGYDLRATPNRCPERGRVPGGQREAAG